MHAQQRSPPGDDALTAVSIQTLGAKSTRRTARETGIPTITRAWVDNEADHHLVLFATWDHLHGRWPTLQN